ncbi:MetQ/NlpA family ABC transporter substrate-binding protein [Paeniglutamicibacter antarcticus]|uniref:MetQ/NlpA family ABC transporter substrate-binding protein n=1 Tax=Paeniglutamicibacter antarcticus TaxID=494023 RepID=A0ABP9TP11_9MICC
MTITDPQTQTGPESHGFTLHKKKKWPWAVGVISVAAALTTAIALNGHAGTKSPNNVAGATLTVVTAEGNHAEQALVNFVAEEIAPKYGIKVAFKGLADSTTLNRAVSTGEVAGTIYQHKLWLSQVLEANPDFKLEAATPVFRWGFGIWSEKYKSVEEIPDGATISLYSDPANEAQGLHLLERAGLIKLADGVDKWKATQKDVAENPKGIKFKLLDFAAQSRSLPDLDAAVGYTEYYVAAKVPLEQQIFAPPAPDEFAGQLTVATEYRDTENVKNLIKAFQDPAVQEFLRTDPSAKDLLVPIEAK